MASTQRSRTDSLGLYAEGWTEGDADKILSACATSFQFGDPEKGPVLRQAFAAYFREFEQTVGRAASGTFMDIEGVVAFEAGDKLVACCRWTTGAAKDVVGTGLIVVGDRGVEREDVALV